MTPYTFGFMRFCFQIYNKGKDEMEPNLLGAKLGTKM